MRKVSSTLVVIVLVLLALGMVMLASSSSVRGVIKYDNAGYFLRRQAAWLLIGILTAVLSARMDYHLLRKYAVLIYVFSIILMVLVFIPGIGARVGGSSRWIRLAGLSFQPSELGKFAVIVILASWMDRIGRKAVSLKEGLIIPVVSMGVILFLTLLQPDFGTTVLTAAAGMLILYAAGTRIRYLAVIFTVGVCLFVLAVLHDPVRLGRVMAFVMPEKYPVTAYHLSQSKVAFVAGGPFGVGLGNSIQKQLYLPEAHTDFILAIIGEELGFVSTSLVVLMYVGMLVCGIIISVRAADRFGRLLAFGLTMALVLQAAINIGVVTGCMPTKGLPLPFISYGGSNLMISLVCIGVLLNIAAKCEKGEDAAHNRPIKDITHRI